jgi:hypothetical protein
MFRFALAVLLLLSGFAAVSEAGPRHRYAHVAPQVYAAPIHGVGRGVVGSRGDGLDEVNAKRALRGLRPFIRDENLVLAAEACAAYRANYLMFGHTNNDFGFLPFGVSCNATGCAAYDISYGWMSCCTYENYTYAGAFWVTGNDGRRYMHLYVR